jgi:O-antigen ligase
MIEKIYKEELFTDKIGIFLVSILPITFIIGSSVLNSTIVLLDLIFLYTLVKKKQILYLKNKYFYSLIFIWLILLVSLFFSSNFYNSSTRAVGFLRFIFFIFSIKYFFEMNGKEFNNIIIKTWSLIFFVITFDLIFEYIFGFNVLGFKSPMHGRLAGFLGDELKIGGLYFGFAALTLAYVASLKSIKKDLYIYMVLILFISTAFIIGERSNFLKTLFILIGFILFYNKKKLLKKIFLIMSSFIIIFFIISTNDLLKYRFWTVFLKPMSNNPVLAIKNSQYGLLYEVGIQMFNNNKTYGVGLKNFREEMIKDEYNNAGSNHPHQLHFEILAEIGIVGYFSFFIFFVFNLYFSIKSFLTSRNNIQLSAILFVFCTLIPLLPSGSFFSSFGASIFWLNFALMLPKNN